MSKTEFAAQQLLLQVFGMIFLEENKKDNSQLVAAAKTIEQLAEVEIILRENN